MSLGGSTMRAAGRREGRRRLRRRRLLRGSGGRQTAMGAGPTSGFGEARVCLVLSRLGGWRTNRSHLNVLFIAWFDIWVSEAKLFYQSHDIELFLSFLEYLRVDHRQFHYLTNLINTIYKNCHTSGKLYLNYLGDVWTGKYARLQMPNVLLQWLRQLPLQNNFNEREKMKA